MKLIVRLFLNMMETFKKLKWKYLFIAFVNQLNFINYSKSVAKYHNNIDKQMKRSRFSFKFVIEHTRQKVHHVLSYLTDGDIKMPR